MRQFTLPQYIRACAETKATSLKVVPSVAVAFIQHPLAQELDLSSIKYVRCAGATLQLEVVEKLQNIFKGVHFVQGYGMSEAAIATMPYNRSVEKTGSVGRLLPQIEIRIVDEDFRDVELGKTGEVLARGPTVFMGYKNNERANKESFHNGWLKTGDILSIDQDGFLWFHERQKEMIKVKGNQVAPSELEGILGSHPHVIEAAVCGYFDSERQTEWPIGYVVLAPSVPMGERRKVLSEIKAWVDQKVAPYKRLRGGLHYIESLPKNPTGKLQRNQLPSKLVEKREAKV
jgi:acyl-coenzyme A synthetase/AMP-(fatty) acid ligase